MDDARRYRLDDLRRFGAALAAGVGVSPARSASFASHLLWFDAAGAPTFGIASLPDTLNRLQTGEIDPRSEGRVVVERTGTAVFEAGGGVPLLALGRAAEIASEKAREVGVGLVRVRGLTDLASAAVVAAEVAVGPAFAVVVGPAPSWTIALPSGEGLPAVFDSALANLEAGGPSRKANSGSLPAALAAMIAPWALALADDGGWMIAAVSATALEPLASVHGRVDSVIRGFADGRGKPNGWLSPRDLDAHRERARSQGVHVAPARWKALCQWAERVGAIPPEPAV